MENIGYSKWAVRIVISVLVRLLAVHVIAQPGFLSIDCGGKTDHTDENNITWVTDSKYINTGETEATGSATLPSYLQRVRFFPNPLNKSCYQLSVTPNVHYLLRLWFAFGNYSRFDKYPSFSLTIETLDMLNGKKLNGIQDTYVHEGIYVSSGKMLYICLIRDFDTDDPFINAIELRALQNGMYGQAKPGTLLILNSRKNGGGNSTLRYPQDNFDRIWRPYSDINDFSRIRSVFSQEPISLNDTKNLPPCGVIQNAWVMNVDDYEFSLQTDPLRRSLLLLYFAEIETLNTSSSFYVNINVEIKSGTITLVRNYSALELAFISKETPHFSFHLVKATDSTARPILNGFEYYSVYDTKRPKYSQDIEALQAIKKRFDIKNWISDPCFGRPWQGISSSSIRILKINFSGRNFSGSVPEDIGRLNAMINLTLDNNQLSGPLPNFSSLTMLERLYSGNRYLCMHKGECVVYNSRKEKVRVVPIITICGALVIALALTVAIAVYRKKFRAKRRFKEDCSMVMVLNPTKSRAFTWEEMVKATQNFNRKIGQRGFGSVFFGTLPEGNDVAVKVLSLFSKAGIHQFENEVDLLSLIGYCHESRELMLIYEYMPEGSLRDSPYGPNVEMDENGGEIAEIIDNRLGGNYDIKSITCVAKLAMRCVDARPLYRPSASEVVAKIKEAILHENENNGEMNMQHGDLQGGAGCSRVDDMEWEDKSSNLFQVGR